MEEFNPIDKTAESIEKAAKVAEGRMTFIQDFLQKKYAWGILFFMLFTVGIVASVKSYNEGILKGALNSKEEIESLKNSLENRKLETTTLNQNITTLNQNIVTWKSLYDDCNSKTTNFNLEDEVQKALDKSKRLERILEKKVMTTDKKTEDLNSIIPTIKK